MAFRGFPRPRYLLTLLIAYSVVACAFGLFFILGVSLIARPGPSISFLLGLMTGVLTALTIGRDRLKAWAHWWSVSRYSNHQSA
jgi:hypothetical protein